ncbi:hypothetical protein KP806_17005 [Paenibacillus sp. N4]|uniref:hypothetical protein n=1 Tax=Paenibacillus vietnamensis TaxID=2590547 RepID=UPI001CD1238B|nr:hypothetical protein [Paenibacillus vietnamensis]MCA0756758.1 hypothetical protein [Paenibacillus vietnamensis]
MKLLTKTTIPALALALLLSACGGGTNGPATATDSPSPSASPAETQPPQTSEPSPSPSPTPETPAKASTAQEAAAAVILALKEKDLDTLAAYIHPGKGLLFSPYGHIDTATAKVFPADGLPALTDSTVYNWGAYDGTGDPIELTFKEYYDKFVYGKDFINAEEVGDNEIKGHGNTIVNIEEVFPGSRVMDYYFSGFDKQYEGMDWQSLILVLEESEGAWYVSAIVHNQWTI